MKVAHSLSGAKTNVLLALYRMRYATVQQIALWSDAGRHQSRTYALLSALSKDELINCHNALQPYIYSLTREGYRVIGKLPPAGSRQESWSVLTHQCHANEAEIKLQEHFPGFQFLPKPVLYKMGLNPAIAEHCGVSQEQRIYVLVDDYLMQSNRLLRVKTRSHRPKKGFFDFTKPIPTWSAVASKFICVTTLDSQYALHKKFLQVNRLDFSMMKIGPLW